MLTQADIERALYDEYLPRCRVYGLAANRVARHLARVGATVVMGQVERQRTRDRLNEMARRVRATLGMEVKAR